MLEFSNGRVTKLNNVDSHALLIVHPVQNLHKIEENYFYCLYHSTTVYFVMSINYLSIEQNTLLLNFLMISELPSK